MRARRVGALVMAAIPPNPYPAAPSPVWRDLLLALVVGAGCYALSCWLVPSLAEVSGFGVDWELMSEAPFELRGRFPHRLLAPLLAHGLGLGKPHYMLFTRGLAVLLLVTVALFCRRRGAGVLDTALIVAAVALVAPVQMYKQQWVGYSDPLCYALFFASLLAARRPVLFWALFFANLTNHELAVFLLPWLWWVRREANGSLRADLVGAGAALAAYGAFYLWVRATAPQQLFVADYFAQNPMFPGGTFAICTMSLTHLVTAFGPVLAVLAWHAHTTSHGRERRHTALVLLGMAAIFCIAWDWSRHSNLIVLPLTLASLRFLQAGHRLPFVALVAAGAALMTWISPWQQMAWPTCVMANPALLLQTGVATGHPVTGQPMGGPLSRVVTEWVPAIAPYLAGLIAIAVAIWLTGWWLARRDRAAAATTADRAA